MQLRTIPLPGSPPADGLVAHVLLVGGNDRDLQSFRDKLKPLSIGVPWQWANVTAGHRQFPRCSAVIVFTRAIAHSLFYNVTSQAKNAKVPVIAHDTWPKTLLALEQAKIGIHPPKEAPVPTPPPAQTARPNSPPTMDDVIEAASSAWKGLPVETRTAISTAARNADQHIREPMAQAARDYLRKYAGNPRAFMATLVLATPGVANHMTQSGCIRVYRDVVGKKAEPAIVSAVAQHVAKLGGPGYGLRKGETFDLRTLKAPTPPSTPVVETPMPTPVLVPTPPTKDVYSGPVWPPGQEPAAPSVRARFERMLHAALDAGETVTVTRVDGTYALAYEDGTLVTVRNR